MKTRRTSRLVIDERDLARQACHREGKRKQVDIAQMAESLNAILGELAEYEPWQVAELVSRHRAQSAA